MVSVGVTVGFTVTVMAFDVTVAGDAQLSEEVSLHVTAAPLVRLVLTKVGLLVPALLPFTCHW